MNYLVDLIIRPKRSQYILTDLGQTAFNFGGQDFKRLDFYKGIKNINNEKLSCSLWCPLEMTTKEIGMSPCIIYCHGNAGNKIDVIDIFEFLYWEYNVCSFDFSGAGYSEGKYVTLGYKEHLDIKAVVDFLRNELKISKIIIWGRSMGAVSALRYAELDPNIKAIVLDSPFCHFPDLIKFILNDKMYIPEFLSKYLFNVTREKILSKIPDFDILNFIPENNAAKIQVPTIIIHGKSDSLVPISHSNRIYKHIPSKTYKKLLEVDGVHNSSRSSADIITIRNFIMQFSYDPIVLKEHKRRMLIKTAHSKYINKKGINIQQIIQKAKNSYFENEWKSLQLNPTNLSTVSGNLFPKKSNKNSDFEEKTRVLNNLNFEKERKRYVNKDNINKRMSAMYKSESNKLDISAIDTKSQNDNSFMETSMISVDVELSRIDSDSNNLLDLMNNKQTLTPEQSFINKNYIESKQKILFKRQLSTKKNRLNKSLSKEFDKHTKKRVFKAIKTKEASNLNIKNNSLKNEYFNNKNTGKLGSSFIKEKNVFNHSFISSKSNNTQNKLDDSLNLSIERRASNISNNNILSPDKSPSLNKIDNNLSFISDNNISLSELDESIINLQNNTVNIGGFNYISKGYTPNKNRLRSDRNNILGEILNCGTKITSGQIKITKIDKSSFKKSLNQTVSKVSVSRDIENKA